MKLIRVAGASLNQTPGDWKNNLANILEAIRQAREHNVSVLCLNEMVVSGYGMEDNYFCLDASKRSMQQLAEIAKHTSDMIVTVGLPLIFNNSLYNATALIVNTEVIGFTCKQNLASDGVFYETRWFKPWKPNVVQEIYCPELNQPYLSIGDIHFNIGGIKYGIECCEEAFMANRTGIALARRGIDVILNPSASNFSFGKLETRKNLVIDGSRAFNVTYVYSNLNGNESGRIIFDGGTLIAQSGNLITQGQRFSYKDVVLTTAVVDIDNTRTSQVRTASFQPDIENYNSGCVKVNFNYPPVNEPVTHSPTIDEWETSPNIKHEECTRALGLALMDYMRKSHTKGFVVSLSGGADSAMVTYACAIGIKLGISELGSDLFIKKYATYLKDYVSNLKMTDERIYKEICRNLITTAYQATENSGEVTKTAAREIANALGVKHFELDVQPIFQLYKELGKQIKGSELNFEDNDIVLQNLQARTRSPSIWIIANMEGKLLLTTSNRSESSMGYGTMNGDISGGICPIGGLPKTYIREYLRYLETSGNCLSMSLVNEQSPTAELRPSSYKQTDEDDLMPYDLLNTIEIMSMKSRYTPTEIFKALYDGCKYEKNQLMNHILKFFRLFCMNQWKRECMPLSFHMDDHNLDPRSWARLPILNSGYKEELEELKKYVNNL